MGTLHLSLCEAPPVVVEIVTGPLERHPAVITAQGYDAVNVIT